MILRAHWHTTLGAVLLAVASCSTDRSVPTAVLRAPVFERRGGDGMGHEGRHLATDLAGANEVPAHQTPASGEAVFRVHEDGSVSYAISVEDIRNPFMAHIHVAVPGVNGPIVVWLFPSTTPAPGPINSGPRDGRLVEGTFTAKDLVGPLKNGTLAQLLDSIRVGHAYVNVHTSDGSATPGPGNFPGGEIRGQLGARPAEHDGEGEGEGED